MQEVVELFKAHMWFAAFVALTPIILRLLRAKEWWLIGKLPDGLKFLPASAILYLVAFSESAANGDGWEAAALNALVLTVIGAPASVGTYHMAKNAAPKGDGKPPPSIRRASFGTLLAVAMACFGCGALPPAASVVGALPAIFDALGTAEAAVNTFEKWADRFDGAPGVTPELLEQIHGLSQECRQSFAEARELARKGAEFEEQATAALNQGLDTFEALKATLASAGLFREGRLLAPAETRSLDRPDELVVPLPPRRL